MFEIQTPFTIKGIPLKPELKGSQKVDETIIQTLSAIMGFDGEARRLLSCSLGGSLHSIAPTAAAFINTVSTGANEDVTFTAQATSEVMIMANKNNTGDVWVNIDAAAAVDTGWLLDAGDNIQLSINDMRRLNLFIVTSGDKAITLRTV
ncbi:hypothetical protein LCGC14_0994800 [marine sediment metagenome]|uniref:Uncharacterized protein n=1 Tax=marine sediment metagenome TaxID=412755 RepID=A0A0F9N9C8_9ZZZZ